MARAAAEREDDERACGGASLAASPAAVLVCTCGRRRRDLGFLATPHIPSDTCEHERTHEVGHQAVVNGKRDLMRVAPRCRSGLTAHGECLSLTSRCGPHRLCLVNVGGWGAWPGDWVWVSFFTCEPGTLGGPPQPRLLCPCYLTGVKTRLCSSATAEGRRRHGRERRPEGPSSAAAGLAPSSRSLFSSLFLNILALSCTSGCRGPGFVCHRPHRFATLRRLTSPSLAFLVCTRGPGLSPSAESPEFRGEPCGRGVPARGGQSASGAGGRPGQGCGGAVGVSSGHGAIGARPALFRGGGMVWAVFRTRCF